MDKTFVLPSFLGQKKKKIEKDEREERDRLKRHCTNLSRDDLVSHEKSCGTKRVPEMEKASFQSLKVYTGLI